MTRSETIEQGRKELFEKMEKLAWDSSDKMRRLKTRGVYREKSQNPFANKNDVHSWREANKQNHKVDTARRGVKSVSDLASQHVPGLADEVGKRVSRLGRAAESVRNKVDRATGNGSVPKMWSRGGHKVRVLSKRGG